MYQRDLYCETNNIKHNKYKTKHVSIKRVNQIIDKDMYDSDRQY